jgi:formyl-CoA transferase
MADLAVHPHLRRIEIDTPNGPVSYPAPAAIVVDQPRHYGAIPRIGEQPSMAKASAEVSPAKAKSS